MNADNVCGASVLFLRTFTAGAIRPCYGDIPSISSCPRDSMGGKRCSGFLTLTGYCVLLISTCGAAHAGSGNAVVSDTGMLQVMLGLGFVLALMGGLAWLLKRLGGVQQGSAGAIKILGGAAVGQRERVVLVEVADTWLVIGVASGHVSPLHSMPKGEIRESAARVPGNARFAVWLKQVIEKQAMEKQTTGKSGEHNGE